MSGIEACFIGRLGRDAELRMVKGGTMPLLSFTVAVDQQHQGEDNPLTWVRAVCFNDLAEQMAERLVKGVRVYVEGRLNVDLWQPDDGRAPRVNIQVVANVVQPLGQIGRRLPTRGQRTWDRTRHADRGRAQQAGVQPQGWLDDHEQAVADLEGRR